MDGQTGRGSCRFIVNRRTALIHPQRHVDSWVATTSAVRGMLKMLMVTDIIWVNMSAAGYPLLVNVNISGRVKWMIPVLGLNTCGWETKMVMSLMRWTAGKDALHDRHRG